MSFPKGMSRDTEATLSLFLLSLIQWKPDIGASAEPVGEEAGLPTVHGARADTKNRTSNAVCHHLLGQKVIPFLLGSWKMSFLS